MRTLISLYERLHFHPRLFDTLRGYTRQKFLADLIAGVTVGIVALPLAMAFGIASGVKPEAGIFTAIIAGFIISAFGGSRVQIGGPTGAFIVIVYGIIGEYGLPNLLICTVMAGALLAVMGFARLGSLIKYIPRPLISGFTNGIAILIILSQIKEFFGLQIDKLPTEFFSKVSVLLAHLLTLNWSTLFLALTSFLVIFYWPKKWARVPGMIVVLIFSTIAAALLTLPVETIGSRFGGIPQSLPAFTLPEFSLINLGHLIPPALTIALLCAIESLLSATVADGLIDDRHDPNQELIAQGMANIICPFFGGIPATGAIARTAANVKSGAVSPVAGIIHAIALLLIVVIAAPLAKYIPLATLSAILIVVAINMGEWHEFKNLFTLSRSDGAVMLVTFFLTVIFDLTVAVEVGMALASLLFIRRMTELTGLSLFDQSILSGENDEPTIKDIPTGVVIYRLYGALFFGAAGKLEAVLHNLKQDPMVLILKMDKVISMDATALAVLESLQRKLHKHTGQLVLCGAHTQPYLFMQRSGFFARLGDHNITPNLSDALVRARQLIKHP